MKRHLGVIVVVCLVAAVALADGLSGSGGGPSVPVSVTNGGTGGATGAITAGAGAGAVDYSALSGAFKTSTGANTFSGSSNTFTAGAGAPFFIANGTGSIQPTHYTNVALPLGCTDGTIAWDTTNTVLRVCNTNTWFALNSLSTPVSVANGGTGTATGSITALPGGGPVDFSFLSGVFKTTTGAATFSGSSNVFSNTVDFAGGVTAHNGSSFDLSGSSGAFKTPTGVATFGGSANTFPASLNVGDGTRSLYMSNNGIGNGVSEQWIRPSNTEALIQQYFSAGDQHFIVGMLGDGTDNWVVRKPQIAMGPPGVNAIVVDGSTGGITLGPATLSGGALASGAAALDLSGSSGAFKTTTGANTFGGSSNAFTNDVSGASFTATGAKSLAPTAYATGALPGTCVDGTIVWDSTANVVKRCLTNVWGSLGGGAPSGAAGGDLASTYPNPTVKQITGFTGASSADMSGGSGVFKTTTGASSFKGSSNTFDNNVLLAAGKAIDTAAAGLLKIGDTNATSVTIVPAIANVSGQLRMNGGATASGASDIDLSGGSGNFLTTTGVSTFSGSSNRFLNNITIDAGHSIDTTAAGSLSIGTSTANAMSMGKTNFGLAMHSNIFFDHLLGSSMVDTESGTPVALTLGTTNATSVTLGRAAAPTNVAGQLNATLGLQATQNGTQGISIGRAATHAGLDIKAAAATSAFVFVEGPVSTSGAVFMLADTVGDSFVVPGRDSTSQSALSIYDSVGTHEWYEGLCDSTRCTDSAADNNYRLFDAVNGLTALKVLQGTAGNHNLTVDGAVSVGTKSAGQCTMDGATPAHCTVAPTVASGAHCTASQETSVAPTAYYGTHVGGTALTIISSLGGDTAVVNFHCL